MKYNIENVTVEQFRKLLHQALALDFHKLRSNLNIVLMQMNNADLGYAKCNCSGNGALRLELMRCLYQAAIFIKTDTSGPTIYKQRLLYGTE